jgi:threonine aldolase
VLVGANAHTILYEAGGGAALAGVQFSVIGAGGHFSADEVRAAVKSTDGAGHIPPTSLVTVENTHNRGGGKVLPPAAFAEIATVAHERGVAVHIDGARIFNAAVAYGVGIDAWTRNADTVTFCLSKGLGAPVGSVLCGSTATINRAHRYRKMLGGGMRQAGIIAAGGLYALEHNVDALALDHLRARRLATALSEMAGVTLEVARVESNIVIFDLVGHAPADVCAAVADEVLVSPAGPTQVRAVLHRDISDADVVCAISALGRVLG